MGDLSDSDDDALLLAIALAGSNDADGTDGDAIYEAGAGAGSQSEANSAELEHQTVAPSAISSIGDAAAAAATDTAAAAAAAAAVFQQPSDGSSGSSSHHRQLPPSVAAAPRKTHLSAHSSTAGATKPLSTRAEPRASSSSSTNVFSHGAVADASRPVKRAAAADVDFAGVEEFSMLSIRDRVVSAEDLRMGMMGRQLHTIRTISKTPPEKLGAGTTRAEVEWLTIGVLASKTTPRASDKSAGKYMIWTITDFKADINVMLFDDAYKDHWVESEGSIVLISCPVVLPARDKRGIMLSVSRSGQVTRLGSNPDFGLCRGTRKDGVTPCGRAVNKKEGNFCVAHLAPGYKRELQRALVGRPDLTNGGSGKIVPAGRSSSGKLVPLSSSQSHHQNISDGVYGADAKRLIAGQHSRAKTSSAAAAVGSRSSAAGSRAREGDDRALPMSKIVSHSVAAGDDNDGYGYTATSGVVAAAAPSTTTSSRGALLSSSRMADVRGTPGMRVHVAGGTATNPSAKNKPLQQCAAVLDKDYNLPGSGAVMGVATRRAAVDGVSLHQPKVDKYAALLGVTTVEAAVSAVAAGKRKRATVAAGVAAASAATAAATATRRKSAPEKAATSGGSTSASASAFGLPSSESATAAAAVSSLPSFDALLGHGGDDHNDEHDDDAEAEGESGREDEGDIGIRAQYQKRQRQGQGRTAPRTSNSSSNSGNNLLRVEGGDLSEVLPHRNISAADKAAARARAAAGQPDVVFDESDKARIVAAVLKLHSGPPQNLTNGQRFAVATTGTIVPRRGGDAMSSRLAGALKAIPAHRPSSSSSSFSAAAAAAPSSTTAAAASASHPPLPRRHVPAAPSFIRPAVTNGSIRSAAPIGAPRSLIGAPTSLRGSTRQLPSSSTSRDGASLRLSAAPSTSSARAALTAAAPRRGGGAVDRAVDGALPLAADPLGDLFGRDTDALDAAVLLAENVTGATAVTECDSDEEMLLAMEALDSDDDLLAVDIDHYEPSTRPSVNEDTAAVAADAITAVDVDAAPFVTSRVIASACSDTSPAADCANPNHPTLASSDDCANPNHPTLASSDDDMALLLVEPVEDYDTSPLFSAAPAAAAMTNDESSSSSLIAHNNFAPLSSSSSSSPATGQLAAAPTSFAFPHAFGAQNQSLAVIEWDDDDFEIVPTSSSGVARTAATQVEVARGHAAFTAAAVLPPHSSQGTAHAKLTSVNASSFSRNTSAALLPSVLANSLPTGPGSAPVGQRPVVSAALSAKSSPVSSALSAAASAAAPRAKTISTAGKSSAASFGPHITTSSPSSSAASPASSALRHAAPPKVASSAAPVRTLTSAAAPFRTLATTSAHARTSTSTAAPFLPAVAAGRARPQLSFHEAEVQRRLQRTDELKIRVRQGGADGGRSNTSGASPPSSSSSLRQRQQPGPSASGPQQRTNISSSTTSSSSNRQAAGAVSSSSGISAKYRMPSGSVGLAAALGAPVISLSSAEAQRLLSTRSAHAEEGSSAMADSLLDRAKAGAKLEAMEERMMDVDSKEIVKWFCLDCEKSFQKNPLMCVEEGHDVRAKKKREFRFECVGCGHRMFHEREKCVAPCPKCSKSIWNKTSVYDVSRKTDGRVGSELMTHGEEVQESLRNSGGHAF